MKLVIGRTLHISNGQDSISGKVVSTDDLGFSIEDEGGEVYHIPWFALTDEQCTVVDPQDEEVCELIRQAA